MLTTLFIILTFYSIINFFGLVDGIADYDMQDLFKLAYGRNDYRRPFDTYAKRIFFCYGLGIYLGRFLFKKRQ